MVLALLIVHFLLGGLCLAVARGERKAPSLRYWGWGLLTYACGLVVTMARFLPAPLMVTVGNSMIAYAPVLSVQGVLSNTRHRINGRWVGSLVSVTVLILIYNNLIGPEHVILNLAAPSPIAIGLFLYATVAVVLNPPREIRNASRFLASFLALAAVLWIARIAFVWGAIGGTNDTNRADFIISMFALAQIVVAIACTLSLFWAEVRKMQGVLEQMAFSDPLTELPNRRAALTRFREEAARAARHGQSFAMLIFDLDHFKQVNDQHGHLAGDEMLRHVARLLSAEKRVEEMLGRIGGEEFLCFFTDSVKERAEQVANRMRELIASSPLKYNGKSLNITVSGGLAVYPDDGENWDDLFSVADRRLYQSKHGGRDRVTA